MYKSILLLAGLVIALSGSCQQNPEPVRAGNTDYLKKSKRQQTAALVLLGGGATLTATGLIIGLSHVDNEIVAAFNGENSNSFTAGAVLFYTGLACMAASIPFFISSSNSKRKSMGAGAFLKLENRPQVQQGMMVNTRFPVIGLKITL